MNFRSDDEELAKKSQRGSITKDGRVLGKEAAFGGFRAARTIFGSPHPRISRPRSRPTRTSGRGFCLNLTSAEVVIRSQSGGRGEEQQVRGETSAVPMKDAFLSLDTDQPPQVRPSAHECF